VHHDQQARLGLLVTLTEKPDRLVDELAGWLRSRGRRCRFCTPPSALAPCSHRPCTVYAAFSAYLTQPDDLVHRQITELLHHRLTGATAHTMPTPRLSDW
jgi:hypothetical protein